MSENIQSLIGFVDAWWDGRLSPEMIVFGLRWYWWAFTGKTIQGGCLVLALLDLIGKDRLKRISTWLDYKARATNLKRITDYSRAMGELKSYYQEKYSKYTPEEAHHLMDEDIRYKRLMLKADKIYDTIDWLRMLPWFGGIVAVTVSAFYFKNAPLLLFTILALNVPVIWAQTSLLLLKPLGLAASILRHHLLLRLATWTGAITLAMDWLYYIAEW